jgi:hypothetical protein
MNSEFGRLLKKSGSKMLKKAPGCAEASAGRQMQVELCEIPLTGEFEILRVASQRIRSDFLPRRRVGEPAEAYLGVRCSDLPR